MSTICTLIKIRDRLVNNPLEMLICLSIDLLAQCNLFAEQIYGSQH